jgi:hypothetical protein
MKLKRPTQNPKTQGRTSREIERINRRPLESPLNPEKWIALYMKISPRGDKISKRNWSIKRLVERMRQSPVMKYLADDVDKMRSDRIQIAIPTKEHHDQVSIDVIRDMQAALHQINQTPITP